MTALVLLFTALEQQPAPAEPGGRRQTPPPGHADWDLATQETEHFVAAGYIEAACRLLRRRPLDLRVQVGGGGARE